MPGPMHGIKIVDLSIALSGPWAVGILCDQGAEVIKVEAPGIGDIGRWVGVARGGISAMVADVQSRQALVGGQLARAGGSADRAGAGA